VPLDLWRKDATSRSEGGKVAHIFTSSNAMLTPRLPMLTFADLLMKNRGRHSVTNRDKRVQNVT
jgi:hypothetical protein